jgi:hypothetical protein
VRAVSTNTVSAVFAGDTRSLTATYTAYEVSGRLFGKEKSVSLS